MNTLKGFQAICGGFGQDGCPCWCWQPRHYCACYAPHAAVNALTPLWTCSSFAKLSADSQVCLAAEKCGHLDFDVRSDTWWRGQGFHCGDTPAGEVSYADVFWKVPSLAATHHVNRKCLSHCDVTWMWAGIASAQPDAVVPSCMLAACWLHVLGANMDHVVLSTLFMDRCR